MNLIIADNQAVTRAGLHALIAGRAMSLPAIDVDSKKGLIEELERLEGKAAVIIDYTLFDFAGEENFENVRRRWSDTVWCVFSSDLSRSFMRRLSVDSHVGILLKDASLPDIREMLDALAKGRRYIPESIRTLLSEKSFDEEKIRLTASERIVLQLLAKGKSVKEIAAERNCSSHTITTHKKNIFRKIGVNSNYEATRYALRAGLIEEAEYYI